MAKKKILIVDDEVDFLEIMRTRLEANNYDVITSYEGRDALNKVKREKPDVVLLDILMPKMDGLEILRKIRKTNKKLPVFITTAFSNAERFRLANKLGASGFIVKTDDLQSEVDHITTALNLAKNYKR